MKQEDDDDESRTSATATMPCRSSSQRNENDIRASHLFCQQQQTASCATILHTPPRRYCFANTASPPAGHTRAVHRNMDERARGCLLLRHLLRGCKHGLLTRQNCRSGRDDECRRSDTTACDTRSPSPSVSGSPTNTPTIPVIPPPPTMLPTTNYSSSATNDDDDDDDEGPSTVVQQQLTEVHWGSSAARRGRTLEKRDERSTTTSLLSLRTFSRH